MPSQTVCSVFFGCYLSGDRDCIVSRKFPLSFVIVGRRETALKFSILLLGKLGHD